MNFADRLTNYLKKNKISSVKMCEDLGIGKNQLSYWREHGNIPRWDTVEKISNYLNIPTSYLIYGEVDKEDNDTYENSTRFFEIYSNLCAKIGKSPNKVAEELSISSGSITEWKKGRIPRNSTLLKIAKYFNVSVDYLFTGEPSEQKNIPLNAEASNGMKENETIRFYTEPAQSQTPFLGVMPTSKPYFAGGQPLDTNTPSPSSEGHSKSQAAAMELDELSSTMLQLFSKLSTLDKCKIISTLEELSKEK